VVHLVLLGSELRERGIGLHVIEQGIDTAEGRAMFGMLSVLAEVQRELIVANTRDGLLDRIGRRRIRQRTRRVHDRPVQDRADHTAQTLERTRRRRITALEWIDWYNRRLHSVLGDAPPIEYEQTHYGEHRPTRPNTQQSESPPNPGRFTSSSRSTSSKLSAISARPRRQQRCGPTPSTPKSVSTQSTRSERSNAAPRDRRSGPAATKSDVYPSSAT
jgi:Resolvase, N terminal domain